MKNYSESHNTWKIILGSLGILIVTLFYSNYLASELKALEDKNKELYIFALNSLLKPAEDESSKDYGLELEIQQKFQLPNIIERGINEELEASNWGASKDTNQVFLRSKIESFIKDGEEPIDYPLGGGKIYIYNSPLLQLIQYYPLVQVILVSLFVGFGYYLFSTARKSEQNRVWAGMAKETAHQLGTPISAMLAWIQYLNETNTDRPDQLEVVSELRKDVDRLELIADRFSKIGSDPELERTNIYDQLDDIKVYMKRRASRKVEFEFPESDVPLFVNVNRHLFSWVLENLIRNALDAMDGVGSISSQVIVDGQMVHLILKDTGKGIPSGKFKEVFKPGFSTKLRGWGLGLSLAKRIIEDYHKGKIFVKQSKLHEGTTFAIYLPLA
ncbi:MAG: hypothetical protein ACI9FN_000665 [Saprospiraceae bacterium]|jgi:hypothetical protein